MDDPLSLLIARGQNANGPCSHRTQIAAASGTPKGIGTTAAAAPLRDIAIATHKNPPRLASNNNDGRAAQPSHAPPAPARLASPRPSPSRPRQPRSKKHRPETGRASVGEKVAP